MEFYAIATLQLLTFLALIATLPIIQWKRNRFNFLVGLASAFVIIQLIFAYIHFSIYTLDNTAYTVVSTDAPERRSELISSYLQQILEHRQKLYSCQLATTQMNSSLPIFEKEITPLLQYPQPSKSWSYTIEGQSQAFLEITYFMGVNEPERFSLEDISLELNNGFGKLSMAYHDWPVIKEMLNQEITGGNKQPIELKRKAYADLLGGLANDISSKLEEIETKLANIDTNFSKLTLLDFVLFAFNMSTIIGQSVVVPTGLETKVLILVQLVITVGTILVLINADPQEILDKIQAYLQTPKE